MRRISERSRLGLFGFDRDDEGDVCSDDTGGVLVHAEVGAVYLQGGFTTDDCFLADGIGAFAHENEFRHYAARHSVEIEVAGDKVGIFLAFGFRDGFAFEADLRELLGIEVIRAAEMIIALGVVRIDACRFYGEFDGAGCGVFLIDGEGTCEVIEASPGIGDFHVRYEEIY